jgi:hypothetical protein
MKHKKKTDPNQRLITHKRKSAGEIKIEKRTKTKKLFICGLILELRYYV